MAKVSPFYSVKQTVHHNTNSCTEGNNIEKENLRQGTGGKPLCSHCSKL
jgi:transposase-like protein